MQLVCKNPECGREWNYKGKKIYPAYVSCPDCRSSIRLPKEDRENEDDVARNNNDESEIGQRAYNASNAN